MRPPARRAHLQPPGRALPTAPTVPRGGVRQTAGARRQAQTIAEDKEEKREGRTHRCDGNILEPSRLRSYAFRHSRYALEACAGGGGSKEGKAGGEGQAAGQRGRGEWLS